MKKRMYGSFIVLGLAVTGCEPATIADAREQLGRGGERVLAFTVPIIDTTFQVQTLFDSESVTLDTAATGLLGVRMEPESVTVSVGERLAFEAISFDSLTATIDPVLFQVPPGTDLECGSSYPALLSETRIQAIDTAVVRSGTIAVTTANRLPLAITYDVVLNGFVTPAGARVTGSGVVPPAAGDGSYATDVLLLDLAGAKVIPAAARVDFTCFATVGGAPIDPGLGDRAIVQSGVADFDVQRLTGRLDPGQTPELAIDVEQVRELPRSSLDLADFEDAVRGATINDATILLTVTNQADAPARAADFNLGVVRLDSFGNPFRGAQGGLAYETDSLGAPILVPVVDPGETYMGLARASRQAVELSAPALVDRLVQLLLNDQRAALVAAGEVAIGDGTWASIKRADRVRVLFDVAVGLDLTLPLSGVTFTQTTSQDGLLSLSEEDAGLVAERVVVASVITDVVNSTPFGVEIEVAFVSGQVGGAVDIFALPGRVLLDMVTVDAPVLDADGRVVQPAQTAVTMELTGNEVRQLLDDRFTATARVRLLPGSGTDGRGALSAEDRLLLDSRAEIEIRAGGSQ